MSRIDLKIRSILASQWFWIAVMVVFVIQSFWITFSAMYPQAFDEQFHFGLIQTYANFWHPVLEQQPANAESFGAVARDPSFLYHYLMSFPYRSISIFTQDQALQVIFLRLINVAMFGAGLVLFRRLLKNIGLSDWIRNVILAVAVLIPIVPQLAGQINYDNLIMLVSALSLLLGIKIVKKLTAERKLPVYELSLLAVVGLFGVLVKYAYAPLIFGIGLYILILLFKHLRWVRAEFIKTIKPMSTRNILSPKVVILSIAFLSLFALFVQRDVVNVVQYQAVAPNCGDILSVESCSQYSVWNHDTNESAKVAAGEKPISNNPFWYMTQWVFWMWYRLFFAVNGMHHSFENYPPLPVPSMTFAAAAITSVLAASYFGIRSRQLFAKNTRPIARLLVVSIGVMVLALILQGVAKYRETGVLQIMNGRYLLPIMIPAIGLIVLALQNLLTKLRSKNISWGIISAAIIIGMSYGGGIGTFILRSDNGWYWNNSTVQQVNNRAREALEPIVIGS